MSRNPVVARTVPYWDSAIVPDLRQAARQGGAVLVAAHGNSIRALRKHLQDIADADIAELEVPTGIPFRMLLDDDLGVVYADYLGDPEAAAAAAEIRSRTVGRAYTTDFGFSKIIARLFSRPPPFGRFASG